MSSDEFKVPALVQPASRRRRYLMALVYPFWAGVCFFFAQYLLVGILYGLNYLGISFETINQTVLQTVVAAIVYTITIVAVVYIPSYFKKSRTTLKDLGLDRMINWTDISLAPAGIVVYLILSAALVILVSKFFPDFNISQKQDVGFGGLNQRYEMILAFVTLVVIAPVAEEVLMRGYLYGKLRQVIPRATAMIITAALFGALHMQWNVAVDVFALSIVMTILREISGGIWVGILMHMMKNGLAFYILFLNPWLLPMLGR